MYELNEPKFYEIRDSYALFGLKYRGDPYDVFNFFSYEDKLLVHRYLLSFSKTYIDELIFGQQLIFKDDYFFKLIHQAFHTKALQIYLKSQFNVDVNQLHQLSDYMLFNLATLTFVMLSKRKIEELYRKFDTLTLLGPLYVKDNLTLVSFALDDHVYHIPIQIPYYGYKNELLLVDIKKSLAQDYTDQDIGLLKCLLRKPLVKLRR